MLELEVLNKKVLGIFQKDVETFLGRGIEIDLGGPHCPRLLYGRFFCRGSRHFDLTMGTTMQESGRVPVPIML